MGGVTTEKVSVKVLWTVGIIVAAVACVVYLALWGRRYGLDLEVYRAGIREWATGGDPYGVTYTVHHLWYTYPPTSIVCLWPLSIADLSVTRIVVWFLSIVGVATTIAAFDPISNQRKWTRRRICSYIGCACASVLIIQPVRSCVDYGQIEAILMALVAVDQLLVPKRHRGWLTGIAAAIKITPLAFLLIFIVERNTRAALRTVGTFAFLALGMVLVAPRASAQFWLHSLWSTSKVGPVTFAGNQSLWAVANRISDSRGAAEAVWVPLAFISVVAAIGICKWYLRNESRPPAVFAIALVGLLCSPISWTHHWVWVVAVLPLLWRPCTYAIPGVIRCLMLFLVAISIAAPYWWFGAGIAASVGSAVLPVAGLATLVTWRVLLWKADHRQTELAHSGSRQASPQVLVRE
ncbi:MAG TPA: glycosyltransferase 87 family protein [Acidimicrobiales bacterium]|nr:glycosyltransferase 87 family protein [Acidimicrobiales bacterium]